MTRPNCQHNTVGIHAKRLRLLGIALAVGLTGLRPALAAEQPDMARVQQLMQQQMQLMQPQLQQKIQGLAPETKMSLLKIYAQHNRYSDTATLRQVMHEVLSDYQSMVTGLMTDNAEQTADSARRLANHRIPRGGLLPYLGMDKINDESLALLQGFNDSVEGKAKALAAAAEQGDMAGAASYVGPITSGCVSCHQLFRGLPGQTDLLR